MQPAERERVEAWFVSRGIPHFIDDYDAAHDIFTRALPGLVLVVMFELVGAVNLDWPAWANVLAVAGGFGMLATAWAAANRLRGRPAFRRPDRVGAPELAVFVLAPALLPLVFGGQVLAAALTAGGNLLLLGAIYLATSYGLVPMTRWAFGQVVRQVGSLVQLLVRALPLLLLFVTFLFINAEVWAVSAAMEPPFFWATVGLFVALGTGFLVARLPREIAELDAAPRLSRRQRGNVLLVLLVGQGLQVMLVSLTIGGFFVVFGLLVVTPETIEVWTGQPIGDPLLSAEVWDRTVPVTTELLRVAGFLGAFSGLYFTVYVATDTNYRAEFFEEFIDEIRQALQVRADYLTALSSAAPVEV